MSERLSEYRKNGLEEILGPGAVASFSQLMDSQPGDPLVRGMLIRAGRAGFHYWLKQEGNSLEETNAGFSLLPIKTKIHTGLQHFCSMFSSPKRYVLEFDDLENRWELVLKTTGTTNLSPLEGSFLSGFMQEFACWAGMGKLYQLRETGSEDPTRWNIVIEKAPVE